MAPPRPRRTALLLATLLLAPMVGVSALTPGDAAAAALPADLPADAAALAAALDAPASDPVQRAFDLARLALAQRAPEATAAADNLAAAEKVASALRARGIDAAAEAALLARSATASPVELAALQATLAKLRAVPGLLGDAAAPGTDLARAADAARLAGDLQAGLLGPPAAAPAVAHAGPRAAADAVLARWGVTPDAAGRAALDALDGAEEPFRGALAGFLDAYLAYDAATTAAFAAADPQGLADLLAVREADLLNHAAVAGLGAAFAPTSDFGAAGAAGLDLRPVLVARAALLDAAEALRAAHVATPAAASLPAVAAYPALALSFGATDDAYPQRVAVLVDAGGNDTYTNNAGGSSVLSSSCYLARVPVATVPTIPGLFNGNNVTVYVNPPTAGAAALLDLAGHDQYLAPAACGSIGGGSTGAGFLLDAGGDDTYAYRVPNVPPGLFGIEGGVGDATQVATAASAGPARPEGEDRHLVAFHDAVPAGLLPGAWFEGARVAEVHSELRFVSVEGADAAFGARAALRPEVAFVEPNGIVRASDVVPDDPKWPQQYGPRQVRAPAAWASATGGSARNLCIVDTGVDPTHEDLAGARWLGGKDFVQGDDDPMDDHGHGTHVAGIAAATMNNGVGIAGMAQVGILAAKALDRNGDGTFEDLAEAIRWCASNAGPIISMSLGAPVSSGVVNRAIDHAYALGAILIAAAGNSGCYGCVGYPANHERVMAVACTDAAEMVCTFSSRGPQVDVAAPGHDVLSTVPVCPSAGPRAVLCHPTGYRGLSGTSMSTPHVSGVAALVWNAAPDLTALELRQLLRDSARDIGPPGCDEYFGVGLVDAKAALDAALAGQRPPWQGETYCVTSPYAMNGGASLGVGLLVDGGGNDSYAGTYGGINGAALLGVGLLVDGGDGDDAYFGAHSAVNGAGAGSCLLVGAAAATPEGIGALVDLGGEDHYKVGYGILANGGAGCRASGFLLDAAGNDRAAGGNYGTNGGASGLRGHGFLYDSAGDDVYTAGEFGNNGGSMTLGSWTESADLGFLLDASGDDTYAARIYGGNGGAAGGDAFLLDGGGDDVYAGADYGSNGGGHGGRGLLVDAGGSDTYLSSGQGSNGGAQGGTALLLDAGEGSDRYDVRAFDTGGTNGGAWAGTGLLADLGGDDLYATYGFGGNGGAFRGLRGNRGVECHASAEAPSTPSVGMLLDAGGDDDYAALGRGVNGGACGLARGFLLDLAGDDSYTGAGEGIHGGASRGGKGLLLDGAGNDLYSAGSLWDVGEPLGANGGGALGGSGMLLDDAGDDQYFAGTPGGSDDPTALPLVPAAPGPLAQRDLGVVPGRVPLPDSLSPLAAQAEDLGPAASDTPVRVLVGLALRDRAGLEAFLADAADPASPRFQQFLTQDQFNARFGPTPQQEARVRDWLARAGLTPQEPVPNRLLVTAVGDAAAAQRAFGVALRDVRLADGTLGFTPLSAPRVPADVAGFITAVAGLDNLARMVPLHRSSADPASEPQGAAGGECCAFSPQDVSRFYGFDRSLDGAGETVVIAGAFAWDDADVARLNAAFGLPPLPAGSAQVCVLPPWTSGSATCGFDEDMSFEVHLDVALAHGQAPGATIKNYMAAFTYVDAFTEMYNRVVTDNPGRIVTTSWGLCERYVSPALQRLDDAIFANGAALGQSWFAASGDHGARECGPIQAEAVIHPGNAPHIAAVGGTSAVCSGGMVPSEPDCAGYGSETAWAGVSFVPNGLTGVFPDLVGSGGGVSQVFEKPSYQAGCNVPADGRRDVPDVALAADPTVPGYYVAHDGGWRYVGGTSAGAPGWAGFFAALNQRVGGDGLGLPHVRLYELCASGAFHDILAGHNYLYPAGPGYDLATGIGTPRVDDLLGAWVRGVRSPPGAPEKVTALGGGGNATLSWSWPFDVGGSIVTSYRVYRATALGSEELVAEGGCAGLGAVLGCLDTGLANEQVYHYRVSAVNAAGEGPPSAPVAAVVSSLASGPPTIPENRGTNGAGGDLGTGLLLDRRGGDVYASVDGGNGPDVTVNPKGTGAQLDLNKPPTAAGRIEDGSEEPWPADRVTAVRFTDLSTDPDGRIASWRWDFGDGTTSGEQHPTHTYAALGTYPVRLTVTDDAGDADDAAIGNVTILNLPPVAAIAPLAQADRVEPYVFQDASADRDEGVVAWAWDFGDGAATGQPGPPRDLVARFDEGAVVLTWDPPRSPGASAITGYDLLRGTASNAETFLVHVGLATTYSDTAAVEGETYHYQVVAVNADGAGPRSNEARVRAAAVQHVFFEDDMEAGTNDWRLRQAQHGVGSNWTLYDFAGEPEKHHSATHAWQCGDGTSYAPRTYCQFYRYVDLRNVTSLELRLWHKVEGDYYYDAENDYGFPLDSGHIGLSVPAPRGGAYHCQLAWGLQGILSFREDAFPVDLGKCPFLRDAPNANLTFGFSDSADGVQKGGWFIDDVRLVGTRTTATEPPRELRAVPGNARVELAWEAPTVLHGANVTGYKVYRGNVSAGETLLATLDDPAALAFLDDTVTNDAEYFYQVAALNAAGESAKSNEAAAKPAAVIAGSTEQHPEHQYTALGRYNVTLIVADADGAESAARAVIEVVNLAPQAAFIVEPDVPMALTLTDFTDGSTDRDGNVTTWHWDFGDGFTSREQHPSHVYLEGGWFNVTLTATDNEGASTATTRRVFVCAPGLGQGSEVGPDRIRVEWQACVAVRDGQVAGGPRLPEPPPLPDL